MSSKHKVLRGSTCLGAHPCSFNDLSWREVSRWDGVGVLSGDNRWSVRGCIIAALLSWGPRELKGCHPGTVDSSQLTLIHSSRLLLPPAGLT